MFNPKEKGDITKTKGPLNTTVRKDDKFISLVGVIEELEANIALTYEKDKKTIPLTLFKQILETLSVVRQNLYYQAEEKEKLINTISLIDASTSYMEEKIKTKYITDLPIGSELSAQLNVAKTVCRKVERTLISYNENYIQSITFLNSLSKYLGALSKFILI